MNFINPTKTTPQQQAIADFFDENKFIASGLTKGYAIDNFSWIADFVSKSPSNTFMNTHSCYISFFSDQEIMYEEFGNIVCCDTTKLADHYSFLSLIQRQKFAPDIFELTKKQYAAISNKGSESDIIEYFNVSDKKRIGIADGTITEFKYQHEFWRAPAFNNSGYLIQLDHAANTWQMGQAQYYDRYYFAYSWNILNTIELNGLIVNIGDYRTDLYYPNDADEEIFEHVIPPSTDIKRILDVKINITNAKYSYFSSSNEWVNYYNDTQHYYDQGYSSYYGIANFYDDNWNEIHPYNMPYYFNVSIMFFPAIIHNNILEPAKIITNWGAYREGPILKSGQMTFNSGIILNEKNDQSRIVYNVCKHMLSIPNEEGGEPFHTSRFVVHKKVDDNYLYCGVDIDTERNRRYSSVVMTEPYFVTIPLGNGEIVNYMFVDINGDPVRFENENDFIANPNIFLKLKTSKSIINEIDDLIKKEDYNTDIIDTLIIEDPLTKLSSIRAGSVYYNNFSTDIDTFLKRQEDCVDDLIGVDSGYLGIVGQGTHKVFALPADAAIDPSKYTLISDRGPGLSDPPPPDALSIKINGLGFVSKLIKTESSVEIKNYLNLYCSNYYPINAPAPGDDETLPISNQPELFLRDIDIINYKKRYEKIYPMIKLSGINGYIKILEKNEIFKTTRSTDGGYEVIYNVEFPYCPGSYQERTLMNFDDYKETWVLKKLSYISAGSWEADSNGAYNVANERHVPYADDSFGIHNILMQYNGPFGSGSPESIQTASFNNGGGITNISTSQQNLISYPSSLVWVSNVFNLLSITKSRLEQFRKYGTYDIRMDQNFTVNDIKIVGLIDNRKWRFADNKFISYINKENPAYIYDIDASVLFNDFTQYQKDHASIPDMKRWLYGLFSGVSNIMANVDNSLTNETSVKTENVNTFLNNDLITEESNSDIIIEVWDQESNLGSLRSGNWRPLSPIGSDTNKVAGKLLLNNLYVARGMLIWEKDNFPDVPIYSLNLGYLDNNGSFHFPPYVNFGSVNDIINGKSNLVLFDTINNRTYHIAYIKNSGLFYKAYIYYDSSQGSIPTVDIHNLDIGVAGQFSICFPKKQMNKNLSFQLHTSVVVQNILNNLITRFIDIRSSSSGIHGFSDLQRYVDDNNKLFFRVRILKSKNYSVSYSNEDESTIQYLWTAHDESVVANQWINCPWAELISLPETVPETVIWDTAFNWEKISTKEIIRKFCMRYFKCASK